MDLLDATEVWWHVTMHMSERQCGCESHPLAEADDRPQTEAQCAAAAEAATQEPPYVHWQCLPQAAVYTVDTGFEFLWCHLRMHTYTIVNIVTFDLLRWHLQKCHLCFVPVVR